MQTSFITAIALPAGDARCVFLFNGNVADVLTRIARRLVKSAAARFVWCRKSAVGAHQEWGLLLQASFITAIALPPPSTTSVRIINKADLTSLRLTPDTPTVQCGERAAPLVGLNVYIGV